jgi:uncharacterized damage-inducible protein DinB
MSAPLKTTAGVILDQLATMCHELRDAEFTASLGLLQGNSVGKHLRHVIEFFELLAEGSGRGLVNYDLRRHDPDLESDRTLVLQRLRSLGQKVADLDTESPLSLEVSYGRSQSDSVVIRSSCERELAYNIEHAIHHMAIMKIAITSCFPQASLPEDFGIAYSTRRYRDSARTA